MRTKVEYGKHNYMAHHGLIKLIITNALVELQHSIPSVDFIDMDKKTFLEDHVELSKWHKRSSKNEKRRKYLSLQRKRGQTP